MNLYNCNSIVIMGIEMISKEKKIRLLLLSCLLSLVLVLGGILIENVVLGAIGVFILFVVDYLIITGKLFKGNTTNQIQPEGK